MKLNKRQLVALTRAGDSVETRIAAIVEMMREMRWERGKSADFLAQLWSLDGSVVRRAAAEASRLIAAEFTPESVRERIHIRMDEIMRKGDDRDAVRAGEVAAKLAGVFAPTKVDISVERMQFEALPPKEQAERLREKAAECIREAERIESEIAIEVKELPQ